MKSTIWHNPRCSKSRETLALLERAGADITVIRYLETPLTRDMLAALFTKAGITAREALRKTEDGAKALAGASNDAVLAAMVANPVLIERPIVETVKGARLCRPPEKVYEIL